MKYNTVIFIYHVHFILYISLNAIKKYINHTNMLYFHVLFYKIINFRSSMFLQDYHFGFYPSNKSLWQKQPEIHFLPL